LPLSKTWPSYTVQVIINPGPSDKTIGRLFRDHKNRAWSRGRLGERGETVRTSNAARTGALMFPWVSTFRHSKCERLRVRHGAGARSRLGLRRRSEANICQKPLRPSRAFSTSLPAPSGLYGAPRVGLGNWGSLFDAGGCRSECAPRPVAAQLTLNPFPPTWNQGAESLPPRQGRPPLNLPGPGSQGDAKPTGPSKTENAPPLHPLPLRSNTLRKALGPATRRIPAGPPREVDF